MNDRTGGVGVDSVVVPIQEYIEVVQAKAVGGILGFMPATGGVTAFTFETEDFHAICFGVFQGHGFTGADRGAVATGAGVELDEEVLLSHLDVAG